MNTIKMKTIDSNLNSNPNSNPNPNPNLSFNYNLIDKNKDYTFK